MKSNSLLMMLAIAIAGIWFGSSGQADEYLVKMGLKKKPDANSPTNPPATK